MITYKQAITPTPDAIPTHKSTKPITPSQNRLFICFSIAFSMASGSSRETSFLTGKYPKTNIDADRINNKIGSSQIGLTILDINVSLGMNNLSKPIYAGIAAIEKLIIDLQNSRPVSIDSLNNRLPAFKIASVCGVIGFTSSTSKLAIN